MKTSNVLFTKRYLSLLFFVTFFLFSSNAFSQSFQVIGPKNYSLKEGDSAKIVIKSLLKSGQNVSIKIVNSNVNHLHVPANGDYLTYLNYPLYASDSVIFYCTYYPKSSHSVKAQIYISDLKNIEHDTVTLSSMDTSDGSPDLLRTKEYLNFSTKDTILFYSSKTLTYLNHVAINFRSKTNDEMQGYVMLENKSGNFKLSSTAYKTKFSSGPYNIDLDYNDTIGYGNHDTAMVILYPLIPRDAKPDTIMIYAVDDNMTLTVIPPHFLDVLKGVKTCRPLKIINPNDSSALITEFRLTGDVSHFSLDPSVQFPLFIPGHSEKTFPVCYFAPDSDRASSSVQFVLMVKTFLDRLTNAGVGYISGSTDFGCFSISKDTLFFADVKSGKQVVDSVTITNRLADSVEFNDGSWMYVDPSDTNLFTLTKNPFPLQLAAGESKNIYFTFNPDQKHVGKFSGLYEIFVNPYVRYRKGTDTLCWLQNFQLIGSASNSTSVLNRSQDIPEISITPNPAYDHITIRSTGARSASFEIFNALGERIASKSQVIQWQWNPKDEHVSEGIYFVRCAGVSESGRAFVETKKLIVRKK